LQTRPASATDLAATSAAKIRRERQRRLRVPGIYDAVWRYRPSQLIVFPILASGREGQHDTDAPIPASLSAISLLLEARSDGYSAFLAVELAQHLGNRGHKHAPHMSAGLGNKGAAAMSDPDSVAVKNGWVERVLGFTFTRPATNDDARQAAMDGWRTARASAIASLDSLARAVATAKLVDADKTVMLLRAIRANLTESPETQQQIDELRNYLEDDDVIDAAETPNGYGIEINLRDPLLDALDALEDG
jgi:hypothetical protein